MMFSLVLCELCIHDPPSQTRLLGWPFGYILLDFLRLVLFIKFFPEGMPLARGRSFALWANVVYFFFTFPGVFNLETPCRAYLHNA